MFAQYIFKNQDDLKTKLKSVREIKEEPIFSWECYLEGIEDLAIQSIELEDMDKNFRNDENLYNFLVEEVYDSEKES